MNNIRFGRNYKLTIGLSTTESNAIIVTPPLTLRFDVNRNTMASANTATFTIINLAEKTRRLIYQDRYDTTTYRQIILEAGYGNNLATIFKGQIRQAYSKRAGTEWETTVDCWDAYGMINGFSSITYAANVDIKQMINKCCSDMPYTETPIISTTLEKKYNRGIVLFGNSWKLTKTLLPLYYQMYIDNNKPIVTKFQEYLYTDIPVLNSDMGLLETPRRNDASLEVKILFYPTVSVGQAIALKSLETIYNSQYKIMGIHHQGVISEAVGGECSTTLSLWLGTQLLKVT